MESGVQRTLFALNLNNLDSDDVRFGNEAKQHILSLKKHVEDNLTQNEIDLAFSALFDDSLGLLAFLKRRISSSNYKAANAEAFSLLDYLLQHRFKSRISQHIQDIKHVCLSYISMDRPSADEKEHAFDVLLSVVREGPWDYDLEYTKLLQILLLQVAGQKRPPGKVLQKEYHLIGLIARFHPECADAISGKILSQFLYELNQQTCRSSNVQFSIITGCMNGLTEFLQSFPDIQDNLKGYSIEIYRAVKKLAEPNQHRKVANRAAMTLVSIHGGLIARNLFNDYVWWHEVFLKWIVMPKEEQRVGFFALEEFYHQIALVLETEPEQTLVFMYFIEFFKRRLLDAGTPPHELRVTIKAFGQFAGACQVHMTEHDVAFMFTLIVQRIEQIYIQSDGSDGANFSDYMISLATIMTKLEEITRDQLLALERITVSLVQNFPRQVRPVQEATVRALTATLHCMAQCRGTHLDHYARNIVYQCIVRTCSHPITFDAELLQNDSTNSQNVITYKSYVPLWKELFLSKKYQHLKISFTVTELLVSKLYDEFIFSVMLLMKKLDLQTRKKITEANIAEVILPLLDPESMLEASTPKDFNVFINLVDLCRDVLPSSSHGLFEKWVFTFCHAVVREAYSKPLVSGFYKLLSLALDIADKLKYFDVKDSPDNQDCMRLVSKFLQQVLAAQGDYKGDLQVACLQVVLRAPSEIVVSLLPNMDNAFQVIFQIGGSFLPLAHSGLDALERWHNEIPGDQLKPLLIHVLKYLDPFLQSKGFQGDPEVTVVSVGKRKNRQNVAEDDQGELSKLQGRIVKFLGQLDSKTVAKLVTAQSSQFYVARDKQHLTYALPFADMKPDVHLDEIVPRVIELALKSSDRRTRVMACELLHAIVLYMLGNSALLESTASRLLESLFDQLAFPLLQLGCDSDQVVNQLFQPLVLQLVHWYSSKYQLRSKQSALLLEALLTGITHETDTAVRDFSAKCLREFVVWSIKQLSEEDLIKSPLNIKAIIKRIQVFCLHPSSSKRLGAALIFNSIYTVLREEEAIVNQFWMEILYFMVVNLATVDESSVDSHRDQIVLALDHVERVLRVKACLFNEPSSVRRTPPEMGGALLKDAVAFLMKYCSSEQAECRHKCMQLVCSLAQCVPGFGCAAQYVNSLPLNVLLGICESSMSGNGIATLAIPTAAHAMEYHLQWFSFFLASLECYVWLIGESLAHPDKLFSGNNSSKIFRCLNNLDDVVKISFNQTGEIATPWETEKYRRAKCSSLIRTFDFIVSFLRKSNFRVLFKLVSGSFWDQLFDWIQLCVFNPNQLGFEIDNSEVINCLPEKMIDTLTALMRELENTNELAELKKKVTNTVNLHSGQMLAELSESFSEDVLMSNQIHFVNGLHILKKCDLLALGIEGEKIILAVFTAMANGQTPIILQPKSKNHAEQLLRLGVSFAAKDALSLLVNCLLIQTKLLNLETQSEITHGDHFLSQVKTPVMEILLESPLVASEIILSAVDVHAAVSLLIEILQHQAANRKQFPEAHLAIEDSIHRNWGYLMEWSGSDITRCRKLLDLLANFAGMLKNCVGWLVQPSPISEWVYKQISSHESKDLHHKNKALELLPCLSSPDDDENTQLASALKMVKDQHFPQSCSELSAESIEQSGFITTFQNILLGLEISGSRVILRSLIAMSATDSQHVCEPAIQSTLVAFITRLKEENQLKAIQLTFDIFSSVSYNVDARLGCVRRFTATLLQSCDDNVVKDFFHLNISPILVILNDTLIMRNEWKSEHQLGGRIGAWLLVEIMFARIDKSFLEHVSCPITIAAFPGGVVTGKELIADLTRKAHNTRQLHGQGFMKHTLFRISQCAAYNALSAIISNTKTEIKFYNGLLFNENKEKQAMIWDRIVDTTKSYKFPLVCDELPTKRKQLVSIRKQQSALEATGLLVEYVPTNTQYLFNSTLSEDVTRFDFSNCVVRSFSAQSGNATRQQTSMSVEISLEDDELNNHECMATVCAVIQHMADTGLSPLQDQGMPSWMENLKEVFADRERHQNVNLFIAKLILNCENHFKPYAKYWVSPIMEAVSDGIFGPFANNCLLNDLIAMVASWGGGIIDKNISCAILELLISSCDNERREIFRHYLELTRTFVEIWKVYVDVPYQLLLEKLCPDEIPNSRGPEVAIQLAGIFLANGIAPWNSANKGEFLQKLVINMNSPQKSIYQPCSEVIGLTLKLLEPEQYSEEMNENRVFLSKIQDRLRCLSQNQTEKSKFIVLLYGIYKYYMVIVDQHMTFITFNLPKLYNTFKTICLEMLWARLELLQDTAYAELMSKGLRDWLTHEDSRNQELALKMILKMAKYFNQSQLQSSLAEVCQFSQRKSIPCRQVMYGTLMWVNEQRQETSGWCEANNESRATLIRGLVDSDENLQKAVYNHWRDAAELPGTTAARLAWLLRHLHTSQTEPHFLGCVVDFLLDLAVRTPDFERNVFSAPLHECRFAEYRVLVSWRAQHATIAPMFAQTMASQLAASQATMGGAGVLRATQASLAFQPTIQGHGESHRFASGSSLPSSSLLFTIGSSHIPRRGQHSLLNASHNDANTSASGAVGSEDANVLEDEAGPSRSRGRRFLKDQAKVRFGFAGRELRRQAHRDTLRREQARRRDANVSMYRSYRIGDFPDIEITNAAILKPLQALVKRDALLARQCFVAVFSGVVAELAKTGAQELAQFTDEVSLGIAGIFSATTRYTPTVMAALLNVALNNPQRILLDTKQVTIVAQNSRLASLGCLLLEERLLTDECEEPSAKRRCTDEPEGSQSDWTNLAELYRSVGEWDVVRAIFQQHLTSSPLVQRALDHEAAARWLDVRDTFKLVLQATADETQLTHFYRHSHFKCLAHLSEWDVLTKEICKHVGGKMDALWENRSSRNEMLPLMVLGHLHDPHKCERLEELVRGWMLDAEHAHHLRNEFSEELSVLYTLKRDFELARFYGENKKSIFLDKWSQMSLFSRKLRTEMIVDAQTLGEILGYLSFAGCTDDELYESEATILVHKWKNNVPVGRDSLLLWDTRIVYRFHFLRQIKWRLPTAQINLEVARSHMALAMVKLALDQQNFNVARKYIMTMSKSRRANSLDENLKLEWILAESRVKWLNAEICKKEDKAQWLMGSWSEYDLMSRMPNSELSSRAHLHSHAILHSILKLLLAGIDLGEDLLTMIGTRLGVDTSCTSVVLESLETNVLASLSKAASTAEDVLNNHKYENETQRLETVKTIAEAYLELAKFNRSLSRSLDVASSVLRAMKHDSSDARQLFPWILAMPELVSNEAIFRENFIRESDAVPEWMFLSWLNQILGCIDSPAVATLEPLVLRLATAYPNAVKYAFRLSKETFKFMPDQAGEHTRSLTTRLTMQLQDDKATEGFLDALSCFGQPEMILKYHIAHLISLIDKKPANFDFFINKSFLTMMKESFLSRTPLDNAIHGKAFAVNEKFRNRLQMEYDSLSMESAKLCLLKNTLVAIHREIQISRGRNKLMKDYSPWLHNFKASKWATAIEIPGQYNGESKPLLQHHITIAGFSQNVEVLPSLHCPIRISIIGNDARDHPYLVKFGEDLRQDQRIQQLFCLMNKIFNQDSNCSNRQLGIATYQVIPLSSRHGLIQWVSNTESLKQVMLNTFSDSERDTYNKILGKFQNISIPDWSKNIFLRYSRERAIAEYRQRVNMVPWDIFRRATNNLCRSPEEFFTLRQGIVTSYSAMVIGHWLLGIGDRHLSNCLIDTRQGRCLGIDFGFAFGTATHLLGMPELMPFRLTPHIVNLMQPMKEHGLFRETMLHCLRALRNETSVSLLLATMEVFIQEPSIDWRQHAWKAMSDNADLLPAEDEVDMKEVQFARAKISASRRKLEGQNPAAVTCADLELGAFAANILDKYIEVARGDPDHNARACLPDDMLTSEDQVKCLLDQATDEHILGKTYIGWEPWV